MHPHNFLPTDIHLYSIYIVILEDPNFKQSPSLKWQGLYSKEGAFLFKRKISFGSNKISQEEIISQNMDLWVEANSIVEQLEDFYKDIDNGHNNIHIRKVFNNILLKKYDFKMPKTGYNLDKKIVKSDDDTAKRNLRELIEYASKKGKDRFLP